MVDLAHCGLQDRLPPQEGMLKFLEQIGFSHWTGAGEKKFEGSVFDRSVYDNWNYKQDYTRNSGLAAWLDTQVGKASMHAATQGTRQCQSDFDVDCTIDLIKDIGNVGSVVDNTFEYIKKSFCIFELYATVQGDTNLMRPSSITEHKDVLAIDRPQVGETLRNGDDGHPYWIGTINAESTLTRRQQDKLMIDRFIQQIGRASCRERV